ncbi:hypothetical protein [Stutzerimonas zhaodongensis]|uniref:hypothetical protein n=1 Tax=Stutzerimonas zhaodongensis TaxID=1176257 RepID=UPI0011C3A661|nr:hypothetical protein [Stutzerimonas zhaodongensis]MCQ4315143.1 hypothetical protein [Stutzerimonas zhaodongensis]
MNVQWNSKQDFQGVSRRRPERSPSMTNRLQTGRTNAASVFTVQRRQRQLQAEKARAEQTPSCLWQIDRGFARTPFSTAISSASFNAASIDYQAKPQISGSEHAVRPEDCFPAGKRNLTARGT